MTAKIIVLGNPAYVDELCGAFDLALRKHCENVSIVNDAPSEFGDLNIYLAGLKPLTNKQIDHGKINVLCQLEELWKDREAGKYRNELLNYNRVLELYEENCRIKNTEKVVHFPLGYSPAFGEPYDVDESLDAFFFGAKRGLWGERRRWEFERLLVNNGYENIIFSDNIGGKERTRRIREAKINLFIRHSHKGFYCPMRALSIQCKGKFLLNEKCQGGYGPYMAGKHFAEFDGHGDFLEKFKHYLKHEDERKTFVRNVLEDLKKNHRFDDYFEKAMEGIL